MATVDQANAGTKELVIGPRDILFECPACGKSLVVDEAGEGMIVDCPQCHINVIVPPKAGTQSLTAQSVTVPIPEPAAAPSAEDGGDLHARLVALGNKMKELQTQRAEINNRMAARINDINRDLVLMARLETAHQQVVAELNQLVAQVSGPAGGATSVPAGRTRVNLRL
jgi:hypothetical protein